MLGSANSIACCNIMLNAAVAESLRQYADKLEKAKDFDAALHSLIRQTIKDHKRIIFNGNGYDDAWIKEATEVRGLLNLRASASFLKKFSGVVYVGSFSKKSRRTGSPPAPPPAAGK